MIKKIKQENILPYTIDEVRIAFIEALEVAKDHGLNWRNHVKPKFENDILAGYYILDETFSTTVKIVMI